MKKADVGIIGMGVMGQNLALNMERNGYTVCVYNRTSSKTEDFIRTRCQNKNIIPVYTLEEFVSYLKKPRKVLLMVQAGIPTDEFIDKLILLFEKEDIIIDGSNAFYRDTDRRIEKVTQRGIYYLGAGISGGEYGALYGPSIMVGGNYIAYEQVKEIFTKIAAKVEKGNIVCCEYLGRGSVGHYVKMVHNGIEYAIMQLLAESYDLMKNVARMSISDISDTFQSWSERELNSYLVKITVNILRYIDNETKQPLVELILDKSGQKGTGRWFCQSALDLGVPVPSISAAVESRIISTYKDQRIIISKLLAEQNQTNKPTKDFLLLVQNNHKKQQFLSILEYGVYVAILLSFVQGLHLLKVADKEYNYGLDLVKVLNIWQGGCIIQAELLGLLIDVYKSNPEIENLLLNKIFIDVVNKHIPKLRNIVIESKKFGIPTPTLTATLDYYDSYRTERLPANLIQGMRDYFGAHTYERIDKKKGEIFHTEWQKK